MALNPEERQAITGLFDRLRENGLAEKDSEAEALINQLIRRTPDSAYMIVQSVLIQEQQIDEYEVYMDQQEARIKELEDQLNGGRAPAQSSSGGFLGGARRGAAPAGRDSFQDDRGSGMPSIGSRSGPSRYDASAGRAPEQPWRGRDPSYAAGQGPGQGPGMGAPPAQQQPQQGGGGGFLRTAAAMAAGVAGGALLTNSLGGMFGGHKGGEAQAGQHGSSSARSEEASQRSDSDNDPGNYDSNVHEAGVEEGDWGGGGGDSDIDI
jgi:hypothetical protein